jgi:ankyrin repeat protein
MSAYRGDAEKIQDHLNKGFPVDFELNDAGWRLVHVAAHVGDTNLMKLLIQSHADMNVRDNEEQWTPMMIATMNSKVEIVRLLINNGADPYAVDSTGKTALDLARQYRVGGVEDYLTSKLSTISRDSS